MSSVASASTIRKFLELIRFSHTIFALPFAALSAVWAIVVGHREGTLIDEASIFQWRSLLGILVCMVAARSFAMAVNRIADREFDAANPRTAGRHLPSGQLSLSSVVGFAVACAVLFIVGTAMFLPNRLPLIFSIPLLLFLAGYSYAKRWTIFVHFWLGIALGLAPICAWVALRGAQVTAEPADLLPALWLGLGVALWVTGFDLIYACQDSDVDRQLGLKSLPARISNRQALRVAAICHGLMLIPFMLIPEACPLLRLSWIYFAGLGIVAIVLVYEHSMVSAEDLRRINAAFFQANAVISLILLLVGFLDACYG
jgi:4-hydroxybenzoate polyprenyltransferase